MSSGTAEVCAQICIRLETLGQRTLEELDILTSLLLLSAQTKF